MSASSMPTLQARAPAAPSARLTASVDLPTPPLPDATAMTCLHAGDGLRRGRGGGACAGAAGRRGRRGARRRAVGREARERALDAGQTSDRGFGRLPHRLHGGGFARVRWRWRTSPGPPHPPRSRTSGPTKRGSRRPRRGHGRERLQNVFAGDRHSVAPRCASGQGTTMARPSSIAASPRGKGGLKPNPAWFVVPFPKGARPRWPRTRKHR